MLRSLVAIFCLLLVAAESGRVKRERMTWNGNKISTCKEIPIEFAFGIDSSITISKADFQLAKDFVSFLLKDYDIGGEGEESRAAIFSYGSEVNVKDTIDLNEHTERHELQDAIQYDIKFHRNGHLDIDDAKAIEYIHSTLLNQTTVRPEAEKVGVLITNGATQNHTATAEAAEAARRDGIALLAVGLGSQSKISDEELLSISGSESRVFRVADYNGLLYAHDIVKILYNETCVTTETTQPPCGIVIPTEMYFVFSPKDLNYNVTWPNRFISRLLELQDLSTGFRVGVEDCPVNVGHSGNLTNVSILAEAIKHYKDDLKNGVIACPEDGGKGGNSTNQDAKGDRFLLPDILQRLLDEDFSLYHYHHRAVAVIITDYRDHLKDYLEAQLRALRKNIVELVFIPTSNTRESLFDDEYIEIFGDTPEEQADNFDTILCPKGVVIGDA